MAKCKDCGKETGDDHNVCLECHFNSGASAKSSPKVERQRCERCGKTAKLLTDAGLCATCNNARIFAKPDVTVAKVRSTDVIVRNVNEAADFLNMCADWVLVDPITYHVMHHGTHRDQIPAHEGDNCVLYVDKRYGTPTGVNYVIRLVNLSHLAPAEAPKQAVKGTSGAETIAARESVYGPFHVHAKAEQDIKKAMMSQPNWDKLNDVQKSAMEMIVHKMARILNNSADYDDNWHDIAGYATLAENDVKIANLRAVIRR